ELRTLREVRNAIEVVEREQIRSALRARGDDLGSLDLREMLQAQILSKIFEDERLDAEDVPDRVAARREWAVREPRLRTDGRELAAGVEGQGVACGIEEPQLFDVDLASGLRARLCANAADDRDYIVELDVRAFERCRRAHALDRPRAVAQDDECGARERAQSEDPAADLDRLAEVLRRRGRENACEPFGRHGRSLQLCGTSAGTALSAAAVPSGFRRKRRLSKALCRSPTSRLLRPARCASGSGSLSEGSVLVIELHAI